MISIDDQRQPAGIEQEQPYEERQQRSLLHGICYQPLWAMTTSSYGGEVLTIKFVTYASTRTCSLATNWMSVMYSVHQVVFVTVLFSAHNQKNRNTRPGIGADFPNSLRSLVKLPLSSAARFGKIAFEALDRRGIDFVKEDRHSTGNGESRRHQAEQETNTCQ